MSWRCYPSPARNPPRRPPAQTGKQPRGNRLTSAIVALLNTAQQFQCRLRLAALAHMGSRRSGERREATLGERPGTCQARFCRSIGFEHRGMDRPSSRAHGEFATCDLHARTLALHGQDPVSGAHRAHPTSSGTRTGATWKSDCQPANVKGGGGRGIRTPDTLSGTAVFKTAAINHSAIPPLCKFRVISSKLQKGAAVLSRSPRSSLRASNHCHTRWRRPRSSGTRAGSRDS